MFYTAPFREIHFRCVVARNPFYTAPLRLCAQISSVICTTFIFRCVSASLRANIKCDLRESILFRTENTEHTEIEFFHANSARIIYRFNS